MAKILIVDDDRELCLTIVHALSKEHHTVEAVHEGDDGLHRMRAVPYDLIILDLNIEQIDGMEICREYRSQGGLVPILMLTGRTDIVDKVEGLDRGADDYMTKPFSIRELSSRIKAILRRPPALNTTTIKIGSLELDTSTHTVSKNGRAVQLFPIDFALLEFLMRHPGQVFSGEALIVRIWNTDKEVGTEAIRSSIKRIRQQIDEPGADSMIETIQRIGYKLNSQDS